MNNQLNISVSPTPGDCSVTLTAAALLEDYANALTNCASGDPNNFSITVKQGASILGTGNGSVFLPTPPINQSLIVEVRAAGNMSWAAVTLEDKAAPVIDCSNAAVLTCNQIAEPAYPAGHPNFANRGDVALPTVTDNCATSRLILSDRLEIDGTFCDGNGKRFIFTWLAIDANGNQSDPCVQSVTVNRPAQLDPPADITWSCTQVANNPNVLNATPVMLADLANSGSGFLDFGSSCGYSSTVSDQIFPGVCENTYRIERTWTVDDNCNGSGVVIPTIELTQTIYVQDITPPSVAQDSFSLSANNRGVHPQVCRSTGMIPAPRVSDNCSTIATPRVFIFLSSGGANPFPIGNSIGEALPVMANGQIIGFRIPAPGIPIGEYLVNYQVRDVCDNSNQAFVPFTVIDNIAPTPVCDEITDVSLTTDGFAVVDASVFDDGSTDNCCIERFEVMRTDGGCGTASTFGPQVTFCCDDVDAGSVTVTFQVVDCFGNTNNCMIEVFVDDKLAPMQLTTPPNHSITCDSFLTTLATPIDLNDLSIFSDLGYGSPTFFDNCGFTFDSTTVVNLNNCGSGLVTRTWTATDVNGNGSVSHSQNIFVSHVSDWVVEFPDNFSATCDNTGVFDITDPATTGGEPIIFFETCELIGITFEDRTLTNVPNACYKIERTWTVINWCIYDANAGNTTIERSELNILTNVPSPLNGDNLPTTYDPAQDLHPTVNGDENGLGDEASNAQNDHLPETGNEVSNDARTFKDGLFWATVPNLATADPNDTQNVTVLRPDGYITYKQVIKVDDQVAPVLTCRPDFVVDDQFSTNCGSAFVELDFAITDACSDEFVVSYEIDLDYDAATPFVVDLDGSGANTAIANDVYNYGTHLIRWQVQDRCGNYSSCETEFTVRDAKLPTPRVSLGSGIYVLMGNNMISVNANDLNDGSSDNCPGELQFSFSSNPDDTLRIFDCDDIFDFQYVQFWVTDVNNNQDFIDSLPLNIQANLAATCNNIPRTDTDIYGTVQDADNRSVDQVALTLNGVSDFYATTTTDGNYHVAQVPTGFDYTLTAMRDSDHRNGVTTYDLLLMARHILGTQHLNDPFKVIAADADGNNSITANDLLLLRRLILLEIDALPSVTSWRFIPSTHVFDNANNPFFVTPGYTTAQPFPEVINYNNLTNEVRNANFVAVKIGDVNGTATPNSAIQLNDRNTTQTEIVVEDQVLILNAPVEIPVYLPEGATNGCQFAIRLDDQFAQINDVKMGLAQQENLGLSRLNEGVVLVSWTTQTPVDVTQPLFTLVVSAQKETRLSEVMTLDNALLKGEGYGVQNADLFLKVGTSRAAFTVTQNQPNPFYAQTAIAIDLPQATTFELSIFDTNGRAVLNRTVDGVEGLQTVLINNSDLPMAGVYRYRVATANHAVTKTMILVD